VGTKAARLEEIRAVLGKTKAEFARLMGIEPRYYSHISTENGKGNLRIEHLESLLANADVNPVWVLTGEGNMFSRESSENMEPGEPSPSQIQALFEYVIGQNPVDLSHQQEIMFKLACSQCFIDNPGLKSLRDLAIAARVYLKLVLRYPNADFVTILGIK